MHQIIYMSAATEPFSDDALAELLDVARTRNAEKNISGMLLYHEGSFIQVLEGPERAVTQTYQIVSKDPRHSDVQVLFQGEIEERSFGEWSMGYVPARNIRDVPEGFHPFLVSGFRRNDDTPSMARKAMLAFKGGRWRSSIAA